MKAKEADLKVSEVVEIANKYTEEIMKECKAPAVALTCANFIMVNLVLLEAPKTVNRWNKMVQDIEAPSSGVV